MLVLTRKTQEQIHIGDNITISILKLKGNAVRIGIEAPRDVRVLRGELPTFEEATVEAEATDVAASSTGESDPSDEDAAISEQQWELLKKLAHRAKPCTPAPSCLPKQKAPLAALVRSQCNTTVVDTTQSTVSSD